MLNPFEKTNVGWFVVLIPGFVSVQIAYYFSPVSQYKTDMSLIASALTFSVFNLALVFIIIKIWELIKSRRTTAYQSALNLVSLGGLTVLLFVSIISGWVWAKIDSSNLLYKHLSTSSMISRTKAFTTVFERNVREVKSKVVVSLLNGESYWGWPYYYTTNPERSENIVLYLEPAGLLKERSCLLNSSYKKAVECSELVLEGLLIFQKNIQSIQFLDPDISYKSGEDPDKSEKTIQPTQKL